jgi:hypothetical protein
MYRCLMAVDDSIRGGSGSPPAGGMEVMEGFRDNESLGFGGLALGGPTGTMRDPNSTPIVTSW